MNSSIERSRGNMGTMEMKKMMDEYRVSCNLLTERIDRIYKQMKIRMSEEEYRILSARLRTLREERIELLYTMKSIQEYCR